MDAKSDHIYEAEQIPGNKSIQNVMYMFLQLAKRTT